MIEILPIKSLRDEDFPIFGKLNVNLAKLSSVGLPIVSGIVVTPPNLKLKTTLEQYDFTTYEVIEQNLTLVKKDMEKIPVPEALKKEIGDNNKFLLEGVEVRGVGNLWILLLKTWLDELKDIILKSGFSIGITDILEPKIVVFTRKLKAFGTTNLDQEGGELRVNVYFGKIDPDQLKKLDEIVIEANKKLLIPHEFSWVLDLPAGRQGGGIKLCGIRPYTPVPVIANPTKVEASPSAGEVKQSLSLVEIASSPASPDHRSDERNAVKVLLDLSTGEIPETNFSAIGGPAFGWDGIFLTGEKIYDLNKPQDSFDKLVLKIIECGNTGKPVLLKLADKSEGLPAGRQGMGKVRGALRLIHQKSLLDNFIEAVNFVNDQRVWRNIQLVIPFVRGVSEFTEVKKLLSMKRITRGNSTKIWMEICVPENIINMAEYVVAGLDGFVLNLDELMCHISGFDITEPELVYYKKDVKALLNFLEDGIKLMHGLKVPFIATGSILLYPEVLEYLVEHGIYGVVVERYEADAGKSLLQKMEKKMILRKSG